MDFLYIYLSGIFVFLTPCILPILPFFITATLGVNKNELSKKELLYRTLLFCLGLAIVMMLLGGGISLVSSSINNYKNFFEIIAGIIMLIFSLYYLNIIEIPFLNQSANFHKTVFVRSAYLNSLILGLIFSFTWSPCLSPIMAGVLSYVAVKNTSIYISMLKMFFFSLGIATPLIIASFFWSNISRFFKKNQNFPIIVKKILGTLVLLFSINLIFNASLPQKKCSHIGHQHSEHANEQHSKIIYNKNTIAMVTSIDCEYCELASISLEKIRKNCPEIGIAYLDVSAPETGILIYENDILGTPAFIFYDSNNKILDKFSGYMEEADLVKTINSIFKTNCSI